jgi:hypothetical protein
MGLESWHTQLKERIGTLHELLEGTFGHVVLLLVGVDNGELKVVGKTDEVWFQLSGFAVGGCRLVIAADDVKDVAPAVERIGIVGTQR